METFHFVNLFPTLSIRVYVTFDLFFPNSSRTLACQCKSKCYNRVRVVTLTMKVANYIQLARTQMHLTQEYLAENIGVSRQAISRWENGQAQPSARNMVKIAALLNVSVDQLTGAAPLEPPTPATSSTQSLTEDLMESWNDLFQRTMGADLSRYTSEHIRQTVQSYMQQHDLRSVSSFIRLMSASRERRMEFLHAIQPPAPPSLTIPSSIAICRKSFCPASMSPARRSVYGCSVHPAGRKPFPSL